MKKIYKIFCIFFLALFFSNNAFSYWVSFDWKGFYSNISNNLQNLNKDMYSVELQSDWWTKQKINSYSWEDCLNRNLTEEEIRKITENEEIWDLADAINSNCKDENWNIDMKKFLNVISWTQTFDSITKSSAASKTEKVMSISNIWIYSDWDESNSPFDLKRDLLKIDDIIFWEKNSKISEYQAEENINLLDKLKWEKANVAKENSAQNSQNNSNSSWNQNLNSSPNNLTKEEKDLYDFLTENKKDHKTLCDLSWNCDNYTEVQKLLCEKNWNCSLEEKPWFLSLTNNFDCKLDTSWLNTASWKIIMANLTNLSSWNSNFSDSDSTDSENWNTWNSWNKLWQSNNSWNNSWRNSSSSNQNNISVNHTKTTAPNISSNYSMVDDKSQFPCNKFFCIKINFRTFDHSFLWVLESQDWNPSIHYLINRSNEHYKDKINSSLSQAKMTINNIELSLRDLNLTEMFHIWYQISYEPVPILYLDKWWRPWGWENFYSDKWELALESQMEKYYKSYWLDYNLRNDLSLFKKIDTENQAVLNSNWSVVTDISNKIEQLKSVNTERVEEADKIRKTIEEKSRVDVDSDFDAKFKEIELYNKALNEYVRNIDAILKEIIKIPVDRSKS